MPTVRIAYDDAASYRGSFHLLNNLDVVCFNDGIGLLDVDHLETYHGPHTAWCSTFRCGIKLNRQATVLKRIVNRT